MANVLAVFAHPDDEVLGCGGTLAKHAEQGDDIALLLGCWRGLNEQVEQAWHVLRGDDQHNLSCLGLADQEFDDVPFAKIAARVADLADEYSLFPDIIYTHHPGDLNLDHALMARVVLTAFRPKPGEKPRAILACEVLSSTEYTYPRVFQPNWYVGLTNQQVSKACQALRCYKTEYKDPPHPRSDPGITWRSKMRGSEFGVEYAEAFQLLRAGPF